MDLNTLFNEFIDSINLEIQTRKQKAKQSPFLIKDGEKNSSDPNGTIYHVVSHVKVPRNRKK